MSNSDRQFYVVSLCLVLITIIIFLGYKFYKSTETNPYQNEWTGTYYRSPAENTVKRRAYDRNRELLLYGSGIVLCLGGGKYLIDGINKKYEKEKKK